jgi:MFS family permease
MDHVATRTPTRSAQHSRKTRARARGAPAQQIAADAMSQVHVATPTCGRWVLPTLLIVVALTAWQQTSVSTAMPQILGTIGAGRLSDFTFATSGYLAGFPIMAPIAPLLSRRLPARWLLASSFGVFLVASALCGPAPTMTQLDWCRVVQGVAGGLSFWLAMGSAAAAGAPDGRLMRLAMLAVMYALAAVLGPQIGAWVMNHGPTVGGLITSTATWRWIFFSPLLLGAPVLAALVPVVPRAAHGVTMRLR